jgi:hypothetical protein
MNGDLSIAPQPALRDLALGAGGARPPAVRPSPPASVDALPTLRQPDAGSDAGLRGEVAHLKQLLTDPGMRVSTHHDQSSGRTVLQVHSRATGEVVEQLPAEALLQLYAALRETLVDECV